jgi:hypothetical protein
MMRIVLLALFSAAGLAGPAAAQDGIDAPAQPIGVVTEVCVFNWDDEGEDEYVLRVYAPVGDTTAPGLADALALAAGMAGVQVEFLPGPFLVTYMAAGPTAEDIKKIAGGHAFDKHVVTGKEFEKDKEIAGKKFPGPSITTKEDRDDRDLRPEEQGQGDGVPADQGEAILRRPGVTMTGPVLTDVEVAVVNNALNYVVNAIPYASAGMGVDEATAARALRYFHGPPGPGQALDPDMARVGEMALRRALVLLKGDPELSILIADEPDVRELADRLAPSPG